LVSSSFCSIVRAVCSTVRPATARSPMSGRLTLPSARTRVRLDILSWLHTWTLNTSPGPMV
jgi:hypothetical protein